MAEWNSDIPPPILLIQPNELFNLIDAISEMIQLSDIFVDACKNFPTILETVQGMFQLDSKFQSPVQMAGFKLYSFKNKSEIEKMRPRESRDAAKDYREESDHIIKIPKSKLFIIRGNKV